MSRSSRSVLAVAVGGALLGALVVSGCGRVGFDLSDRVRPATTDGSGGSAERIDSGTGASDSGGASSGAGGTSSSGGNTSAGGTANGGASGSGASANGGTSAADAGIDGPSAGGASAADAGTGGSGTGGSVTILGAATTISAGEESTCATANGGKLYCWGSNTSNALGGAGGANSNRPVAVQGPGTSGGFVEVAVGSRYGCARHSSGTAYCWGENTQGQLGAGDLGIRPTPNPVNLPKNAARLAARYAVTCSVLVDGSLYCWGDNSEGEMGQNDAPALPDQAAPILVPTGSWGLSAPGQGHVCALRGPGELHCWGRNTIGTLGLGYDIPDQIRTPTRVGTNSDFTTVSAGQLSSCAIRAGQLYCWGDDSSYALGLGDTQTHESPTRVGSDSDWLTVSIDTFHACGIRPPGTLWCWGRNDEGQLGMAGTPVKTPTKIGAITDWVEVTVGRFHTCARRQDQTIWCTGENVDGRLGTGNNTRPYAFTQIAAFP